MTGLYITAFYILTITKCLTDLRDGWKNQLIFFDFDKGYL